MPPERYAFLNEYAPGRVGPGGDEPVDGCVVGDDPRAAAGLYDHGLAGEPVDHRRGGGLAEATSLLVKVFSGALSDRMRRRKIWALAGYSLAAASKPFIAVAGSVGVLAGRGSSIGWAGAARRAQDAFDCRRDAAGNPGRLSACGSPWTPWGR